MKRATSETISSLCKTPVIPVLQVRDETEAVNISRALFEGELPVVEITFRTPPAAKAIAAVVRELPQMIVAAGSIKNARQMHTAKNAGARFAVSPGATDELLAAAAILPLLPGAATASEIMRLLARGFSFVKFFPAAASGGVSALKSFYGPLPEARFCPTGGITEKTAAEYLALPNVKCVGGSWLAADGDSPETIYEKAKRAARLAAECSE
ncbi:MAG: bifunctional 4-hydroxy-2-oxoglutarate aldolase/2-dehydro-3-deoxy-phosphogluconate aldolase [Gammaproteobacteria bacterium]